MNRLAVPLAPSAAHSTSASNDASELAKLGISASSAAFAASRRTGGAALFAPIHYEPGYAYPLIVWLHDNGGCARELRRIMPLISVRNYVGAAAQIGVHPQVAGSRECWPQNPDGIESAADSVARCIESAQRRFHVHHQRVFLVGHGAGGTMALRLALQMPLPVAGVVSLNGAFPRGHCPLARLNVARQLPVLMMTCEESHRYPAKQVVDDLRLLHAAGFSLAVRHYLCGDDLYTDMFQDLDRWLMAQVCQQPQSVQV